MDPLRLVAIGQSLDKQLKLLLQELVLLVEFFLGELGLLLFAFLGCFVACGACLALLLL